MKFRKYLASEFGLPQLRPRVYIVGIREDEGLMPKLPRGPNFPAPPLSAFLEPAKGPRGSRPSSCQSSNSCKVLKKCLRKLRRRGINPRRQTWAIDVDTTGFAALAPPLSFEGLVWSRSGSRAVQCRVHLAADSSERFAQAFCERTPTLIRRRPKGYWLTSHRRYMLPAELFRLQGMDPAAISPLPSVAGMGRMAGNSMAQPVLVHIFEHLLPKLFPDAQ